MNLNLLFIIFSLFGNSHFMLYYLPSVLLSDLAPKLLLFPILSIKIYFSYRLRCNSSLWQNLTLYCTIPFVYMYNKNITAPDNCKEPITINERIINNTVILMLYSNLVPSNIISPNSVEPHDAFFILKTFCSPYSIST